MTVFLERFKSLVALFFKRPKLMFLFRKPYSRGNYSIEYLFDEIYRQLKDKIEAKKLVASFHSRGIIRRALICIEIFFKRGQINIVTGDISFVAALLPKKSTILVILDCGVIYESSGLKRWIEELFWYRIPFKKALYVVAISEATKHDLLSITKGDPSKVLVIPCFIHPVFKKSEKNFSERQPTLLQVGQASNKNLIRIIHAIHDLDIHLSIIGSISIENTELLDKFGVNYSNSINLTDEEIFAKYVESDMLVFPSTYEGFGLPIIEAQTVGRPVITSNNTSMPWVAGSAACLVDPYSIDSIRSGIVKIMQDSQYRNKLVEHGFENSKRFHPDHIAKMYHELVMRVSENIQS